MLPRPAGRQDPHRVPGARKRLIVAAARPAAGEHSTFALCLDHAARGRNPAPGLSCSCGGAEQRNPRRVRILEPNAAFATGSQPGAFAEQAQFETAPNRIGGGRPRAEQRRAPPEQNTFWHPQKSHPSNASAKLSFSSTPTPKPKPSLPVVPPGAQIQIS